MAQEPLLFFTSVPGQGHTNPLIAIASSLVQRGYEVAYLSALSFRAKIVGAGIEFFEMPELLDSGISFEDLGNLSALPIGIHRYAMTVAAVIFKTWERRHQKIHETLQELKSRNPERQIIFLEDLASMGLIAYRYGKSLPQGFNALPKSIGLAPYPVMWQSQDTAPFLSGLLPDSSPLGRERNNVMHHEANEGPLCPFQEAWRQTLLNSGCSGSPVDVGDDPYRPWYTLYDAVLQLCTPGIEYPMSDLPPVFEFVGGLPRQSQPDNAFQPPVWGPEVTGEAGRDYSDGRNKKVVFVSQGTVSQDYEELLIPTLKALDSCAEFLVIAALGTRGSVIGHNVAVPSNARIIDYIPYDIMLAYTDVFVSNAGYGALTHAVANGVPAVFAGESEDKLEVAMRAQWAGMAVNLKTQRPHCAQIKKGVEDVLANKRYKMRAQELRKENERMDCLAKIAAKVADLTE